MRSRPRYRHRPPTIAAVSAVALACAGVRAQENQIDGSLSALTPPLVRAIQSTPTGFGDATLGLPGFCNGSELDAAYADITPEGLLIVLTGNLESNYNKLEIFIDCQPGGQNRLRGDNAGVDFNGLNRMGDDGSGNGLTFDPGFDADFWLSVAGGDAGGSYAHFVTFATLPTPGNGEGLFIGQGGPATEGSLFGGDNPHSALVAIDNSNTDGVSGTGVNDPLVPQTGVEILLPMRMIGHPQGDIRVCVFVNGTNHDFCSNQFLPPLPGGSPNPGEPRALDLGAFPGDQFFVVPNQDFDGDLIPDADDLRPFHFDPSQSLSAPTGQVVIDQVDRFNPDGSVVQLDTDTGVVGVVHDRPNGGTIYVNVEIDGVHKIINMPVFSEEDGGGVAFEPLAWTGVAIGLPGEDVTDLLVRSTATAHPLDIFPPGAPFGTIPVGDQPMRRGSEGPFLVAQPGDAEEVADFEVPENLPFNDNTHFRYGFNVIDLDDPSESVSCSPSSVAASFAWLNRTYKLDLDDTKDQLLDEFERRMGTGATGSSYSNIIPAKKQFVTKKKLPITIEGEGRGSPGAGEGGVASDVNPDNLFMQIKLGQDVELSYRWGGDDDDNRGHALAVIGMTKDDTGYIIQTGDDSDQSAAGGDGRMRTGRIYKPEGSTDWYIRFSDGAERRIVGWRAESPTYNKILKAICDCINMMRDTANGLGDAVGNDAADAMKLTEQYFDLVRLVKIAIKNAECRDGLGADVQPLKDLLTALRQTGRGSVLPLLNSISNDEPPVVAAKIQDVQDRLNTLKDAFNALWAERLANDTDADGIPNDDDNAPNSANPGQEDCNNDGVGDVDQLANANDRNDNAIPDDCEEFCPADWNLDGHFNDQDFFDFVNDYFGPGNADFNHDGNQNDQDFFDFVNAYFSPPCQPE